MSLKTSKDDPGALKAKKLCNHCKRDPEVFVRNVLNAEPDEWQLSALRDIRDGKDVAVRSGHGTGKSALCAWSLKWWMLVHPRAIVRCTAPTESQLKDTLWPEVKKWWQGTILDEQEKYISYQWEKSKFYHSQYPDTWVARYRTSNNPQNMAGAHGEHLLYIVDEASAVGDDVFEVIEGALTDGGQLLITGNPTRSSGEFYRAFNEHSDLYETYHINAEDSGRVRDSWVKKQYRKWGKDSDIVRVRVRGEFPRGTSDAFIQLDLINDAITRELEASGKISIGVDVARFGDDSTVIATRQGPKMHLLDKYNRRDTQEVSGLVIQAVKDGMDEYGTNEASVKVDETGVGGGVLDAVRNNMPNSLKERVDMVGVKFNQNPTEGNKDDYNSAIDEMFGELRDRAESGALDLINNDNLVNHIAGRKYSITASGKIKVESKKDFKKRVGESPDEGDAVMLAYYEPGDDDGGGGIARLM